MTRYRDQAAELVVLAAVLAIAAIASYIHLRAVWEHAGAPVPTLGPLLVDGLFAAAWLRMRRRRRQGVPVGLLAWLALSLALVATVAGNLAAAWIAGHRDPLSLVVAAWPAIAFALVWELVTGHGRRPSTAQESPLEELEDETGETWEQKRDRLLDEGASRKRLSDELGISDWDARKLQDERKRLDEQETDGEATG